MKRGYIYNMGEPQKLAKWKKSLTEGHVLYDSTSMKYPDPVNPEIAIWGWPGSGREGGIGSDCLKVTRFLSGSDENVFEIR